MKNVGKLFIEMAVVGILLVIVSLGISTIQGENVLKLPHLNEMVKGVFITGAISHLLFEISGVNQWYVSQYKPLF